MYGYRCCIHIVLLFLCFFLTQGSLLAQTSGEEFAMNAGLNGNWYGGPERNFEGFNIEVSETDDGQVLVATMFGYNSDGTAIWLLAVGTIEGNAAAEMTVYIYNGGGWGEHFYPALEEVWGSASIVANSCNSISVSMTVNSYFVYEGFTDASFELERVTHPIIPCPYPPN